MEDKQLLDMIDLSTSVEEYATYGVQMKSYIQVVLVALTFTGCVSGKYTWENPVKRDINNSITINKSRDKVWTETIPKLGKQFYTVNNMDKTSGFINLSFTADPNRYVDCGVLKSSVKNARGPRNYTVELSNPSTTYEYFADGTIKGITRNLKLEGKVNLIFEVISPKETRVTANSNYTLIRSVNGVDYGNLDASYQPIKFYNNANANFTTNSQSTFGGAETNYCLPTGLLEKDILDLIAAPN